MQLPEQRSGRADHQIYAGKHSEREIEPEPPCAGIFHKHQLSQPSAEAVHRTELWRDPFRHPVHEDDRAYEYNPHERLRYRGADRDQRRALPQYLV